MTQILFQAKYFKYLQEFFKILHKVFKYKCTTLRGWVKGKIAGILLKYYPEKRNKFEIYPGKVMHIIGG